MYPLKLKTLECTTAVDKAFHGFLRYAYIVELELLELREKKSGRNINLGEIAVHEGGATQRGREAERGRLQRA